MIFPVCNRQKILLKLTVSPSTHFALMKMAAVEGSRAQGRSTQNRTIGIPASFEAAQEEK